MLELAVIKLGRFLARGPTPRSIALQCWRSASTLLVVPLYLLLLVGAWIRRYDLRAWLLLVGPVLYFLALHLVFVSSIRYRIPGEPVAGVGGDWSEINRRSNGEHIPSLLEVQLVQGRPVTPTSLALALTPGERRPYDFECGVPGRGVVGMGENSGLFRFLVRASRDLWAFLLGEGRFPRHSHLSPEDPNSGVTQFTERMVPEEAHARIFWEHVARYRFAKDFVRGKRVLDIACGEGYGASSLAKAGAASVVGVDIADDVCEHARRKYGIDARTGDAQAIPLPDRSIDLIVSFETIEHVASPAAFLQECARVLAPDGHADRLDPEPARLQRRMLAEPVPPGRARRGRVPRSAPLAFQGDPALRPVPPVGCLVELPLARGRAIALAPHQGLLANIVLVLPRDPKPCQPGGARLGR